MITLPVFALALLIHSFGADSAEQADRESITVTIVGTIHGGIVAIGGETTGTTITSKGLTWELDFGKDKALRETAERLNNQLVTVTGALERHPGVEVKNRWIVTVTSLTSRTAESKADASSPTR